MRLGRDPRDYVWLGRPLRSRIGKQPVEGPVAVRATHLEGDEQADLRHHGSDKAVYAYAAEDLSWWSDELGRDLGPAAFGENLTTLGLNLRSAVIGENWCMAPPCCRSANRVRPAGSSACAWETRLSRAPSPRPTSRRPAA